MSWTACQFGRRTGLFNCKFQGPSVLTVLEAEKDRVHHISFRQVLYDNRQTKNTTDFDCGIISWF